MAVGSQQAAVKADFTALHGGDYGQLGGEEILFLDAVLILQDLKNGALDGFLFFHNIQSSFSPLGAENFCFIIAKVEAAAWASSLSPRTRHRMGE